MTLRSEVPRGILVSELSECDETKGHYTPFEGDVVSAEGGFPLVTFSDTDEVVCMVEINPSVNMCFGRCIQEVRDEQKWVMILLSDFVESAEVNAEVESSILFVDEKDRGSMSEARLVDEPIVEVFIYESVEGAKLSRKEGADGTLRG